MRRVAGPVKGRLDRHGRGQAAAGAPDPGHNAVAALVAAALLDLEPGPGVAGGWVDFPGLKVRRGGEFSHPGEAGIDVSPPMWRILEF